MESDFGLTEYASGHTVSPIYCLLKEMFTDFIVQEILADGTVLSIPPPDLVLEGNKDEKKADETLEKPDCISDETLSALEALFAKPGEPVNVDVKDLTKDHRKSIHHFIRERFAGRLITETKETMIVATHGHTKKSRKRRNWDENVPKECHFTMCKENKETTFAIQLIAKFLNVNQNSMRTHGLKDKRGVTAQRVSVTQVPERQILDLNSRLHGIRVFDCQFKDEQIKMGAHWGNRFSIVLRNVPNDSEPLLHERLETFQNTGFINYFGTQRFGSRSTSTAEIGLAIVKRDWQGAVLKIMENAKSTHVGEGSVGKAAKIFLETNDARKAFGQLRGAQAFATIEGTVLACLKKGGTWQKCITEAIPVQTRSLYVHAYQSLIWNKVASRRVKEYGTRVHETDVGADGAVLGAHATHYDIYIPLPGEYAAFDNSLAAQWIKELLALDRLTPSSITALKDKFSLGESARRLFVEAKDLKWALIRYPEPRSLLQDGLITRAIPESERKGDLLALQIQFSLISGSYATVALREITGTDMGKKAMRDASVKNREDGSNEPAREGESEEEEEAEESGEGLLGGAGTSAIDA